MDVYIEQHKEGVIGVGVGFGCRERKIVAHLILFISKKKLWYHKDDWQALIVSDNLQGTRRGEAKNTIEMRKWNMQ